MSALVSFDRVFEVLDLKPLVAERPDPRGVPEGPVAVEFENVRFAYPSADKVSLASLEEVATLDTRGGVEVLHDVTFRAEPGQTVALVGSSGAGKSTIAQMLPRLYDVDSGTVRLGGVDVRDLSFQSIRDTLGMVTQDGHLFHESIRENLLLARPGRPTRSSGTCCAAPASTPSSRACRTASTRSSASAATASPAASASASPSPASCWPGSAW